MQLGLGGDSAVVVAAAAAALGGGVVVAAAAAWLLAELRVEPRRELAERRKFLLSCEETRPSCVMPPLDNLAERRQLLPRCSETRFFGSTSSSLDHLVERPHVLDAVARAEAVGRERLAARRRTGHAAASRGEGGGHDYMRSKAGLQTR